MRQFKSLFYATLFFTFIALILGGCAKPPEEEKAAAKGAMDAALAVGAQNYAPADFSTAKSAWEQAEKFMSDKKYEDAKKAYLSAKQAFDQAKVAAQTAKKAMTEEVTKAVAELEDSWKALVDKAKKVENKMKTDLDSWKADSKTFEDGLKTAKDTIATDPLKTKKKIDELKSIIEKWDAKVKELAAIPEKPAKGKKK
ncbi:MAG: DUF4398 domain-containing protein [Syntrophales bacterium]|nr:DUF4398 domain-containing protein [Syntrophales bacterium]